MKWFLVFILITVIQVSVKGQTAGYISVKDYGAKGDGITDDTKAILIAIQKVKEQQVSVAGIPQVYDHNPIYAGGSKALFFPVGHYRTSQALKCELSYLHIIGEKAIISPLAKYRKGSVGLTGNLWQAHIEGIQMIGFDTAFAFDTKAVESGKIVVEDCDFLGNKVALKFDVFNAVCVIRENRFYDNQKAAVLKGDKVDMVDNWISAGTLTGTHDAQIINYVTNLHFDKNLLVPSPPSIGATEPAWINNFGSIAISGVRQGGESGSFTLVNNFTKASSGSPLYPTMVSIKDGECYAIYGNKPNDIQPAALRLFNVPNNIVLEDLRGFIDAKVVDFAKGVDATNLLKPFDNDWKWHYLRVRINNVQGSLYKQANGTDIPAVLTKYVVK